MLGMNCLVLVIPAVTIRLGVTSAGATMAVAHALDEHPLLAVRVQSSSLPFKELILDDSTVRMPIVVIEFAFIVLFAID